jgi:hypothetical protein
MATVDVAPQAVSAAGELNGVGQLLLRVVGEKLEEGPAKQRLFDGLDCVLFVHVVDVGQSATVAFRRGSASVGRGRTVRAHLAVECDHATFVQFTMFRLLRNGLPDLFDDNGRSVLRKWVTRRLVIRGLFRHPGKLFRFLCFVATPDEEG